MGGNTAWLSGSCAKGRLLVISSKSGGAVLGTNAGIGGNADAPSMLTNESGTAGGSNESVFGGVPVSAVSAESALLLRRFSFDKSILKLNT